MLPRAPEIAATLIAGLSPAQVTALRKAMALVVTLAAQALHAERLDAPSHPPGA